MYNDSCSAVFALVVTDACLVTPLRPPHRLSVPAASQAIVAETHAKRFKLIFEFLAQDGGKLLDLCGQLARRPRGSSHNGSGGSGRGGGSSDGTGNGGGESLGVPPPPSAPAMVDELEPEVRVDLELAAQLWKDDWSQRCT